MPSTMGRTEWSGRCANSPGPGQHPVEVLTMSERTCSIDGCELPVKSRGWCNPHYMRWYSRGDALAPPRVVPPRFCSIDGCDRPGAVRGWCKMHYSRFLNNGDPLALRGDPWLGYRPPICSVPGCGRSARRNGLCPSHSARQRRYGDPTAGGPFRPYAALPEHLRFWSNVELGPGECWTWSGQVSAHGYGRLHRSEPGSVLAHRWSYERLVGPIGREMTLDHRCHTFDEECAGGERCDHRRCVNPTHLEPVTQAENSRRVAAHRRLHALYLARLAA